MSNLPNDNTPAKPKGLSKRKRKLSPRRRDRSTVDEDYDLDLDDSRDQDGKSSGVSRTTPDDRLNEVQRTNLLKAIPREDDRGPRVPVWLLLITDNATDALVLAQLKYWLTEDRGHPPFWKKGLPCKWVALTSTGLGSQLARTQDEIDKSLNRLKEQGFVEWKNRVFKGKLHRHIWLKWGQIAKAYNQAKEADDGSAE